MLNERIRKLRLERNWSQVDLAKRLNVTKQSVSNWENDNIQPSIDMLMKLTGVFSVSADYLLGLEDRRYLEITGLTDEEVGHIQLVVADLAQKKGAR